MIVRLFFLIVIGATTTFAFPGVESTSSVFPLSSSAAPFLPPGCFDSDPAIGGLDRNAHLVWAQRQTPDSLANNLPYKIAMLFNCPSVDGEKLAGAFADMSVIIAYYAPNAACFGNDQAVIGRDRGAHDRWARVRSRDQVRDNLRWKAALAVKCTDARSQADYFADMSIVVAKTAGSSGGGDSTCNGGYGLQAPRTASPGSNITIRFAYQGARPTGQTDWIGLMRAGTKQYVQWYWVRDTQGCEATFKAPAPGEYEFWYALEGGYDKVVARSPLTVR